jgi:predicted thioredoxin/glutaredoxin
MTSPAPAARLTVISRHDCELCETMLAELVALGRSISLPPIEIVDVDSDSQLLRRHGLHVPVLMLDGTVVCRHRLDASELARLLRAPPAG